MSRIFRALRATLRSASLLALLVLGGIVLNGALLAYAVFRMADTAVDSDIGQYAETLSDCENGYAVTDAQERSLTSNGSWLLLLDAQGQAVWQFDAPDELPDSYSLSDVALFTRWYLADYPVHVRVMGDGGLLILGLPKNTVWKYVIEQPLPTLLFWPVWTGVALLCNFLLILLVSVGVTRREYKKRDAARTEWIAAVSHDVRTPLAAVLGYAGSLETDPLLPLEERGQAALIRQKGEELRSLIENLNLTNRLEHSMEPLQAQWLSPAAVVRESVVYFLNDESFSHYRISAELSPAAAGMQLYGDRELLCRMLKNLIGNSIRHNPDGCGITVGLEAAGRRLTLTVFDDGGGFTPEQLEKLAGKQAPLTSGHGLGLTIVHQIAAAHHASVCFSNGDGGGARCVVTFRGPLRVRRSPQCRADEAQAEDSVEG